MKSLCIKTNNLNLLNYLLNELEYIDIQPIVISSNEFKNYKNVIIHYRGNDDKQFVHEISCILSCLVIDELEESFLKNLIIKNYFYFNSDERKHILDICFDVFADNFNELFNKKYNCLIDAFSNYLQENKSLVLTGFINFRLFEYLLILENIIDDAVNTYVIEKEYFEFVSLLKMYINSHISNCELVHLIYTNENSILLDENKNVINIDDDIFKAKYLSDITFSSNDYALNTLLTLLPKKIHVHLIDNCVDEFIHTIGLIFENKVEVCTDCNICKIYKNSKNSKMNLKKISIKK